MEKSFKKPLLLCIMMFSAGVSAQQSSDQQKLEAFLSEDAQTESVSQQGNKKPEESLKGFLNGDEEVFVSLPEPENSSSNDSGNEKVEQDKTINERNETKDNTSSKNDAQKINEEMSAFKEMFTQNIETLKSNIENKINKAFEEKRVQEKLEGLKNNFEKMKEEMTAVNSAVAKLEEDGFKERINKQIKEINTQVDNTLSQEQLENNFVDSKQLDNTIDSMAEKVNSLQKQMEEFRKTLKTSLNKKYEDSKEKISKNEQTLATHKKNTKEKLERLVSQSELQKKLDKTTNSMEKRIDSVQTQMEELKKTLKTSFNKKHEKIQEKISENEQALAAQKESTKEKLEKFMPQSKIQKEFEEINKVLSALQENVKSKVSKDNVASMINTEIDSMKKMIEEKTTESNTQEYENLKEELDQQKELNARLKGNIELLENQYKRIINKVAELEKEAAQKDSSIDTQKIENIEQAQNKVENDGGTLILDRNGNLKVLEE